MAKKKLLIAALIVGAFASLMVYLTITQYTEPQRELFADTRDVVKATSDIPAGTLLTLDRITTETIPTKFLPNNPLLRQDLEIYLNMAVAETIKEGSMIVTSDFATIELSRTLSGRVPVGERAMSLPVDAISGVSGLLRPGDRVDILGTFPVGTEDELIREARGEQSVGYVTMNLLQNVTLLATGQEISDIPSADSRSQQGGMYNTVTMSLTPDEAELLVIAQTRGQLTLLLRHREDMDTIPVTRKTLREVLEDLEVINRERQTRVVTRPAAPRPTCPPGQERRDGVCQPVLEIIQGTQRNR
jgi:pilus assembly protein CpaB